MTALLASPFVLFAAAMAATLLVMRWGRSQAPAPPDRGDRRMPYVGGEISGPPTALPGYGFFTVALFFTLLHVAALVVATAPAGGGTWLPVVYLAVAGTAVLALRWER